MSTYDTRSKATAARLLATVAKSGKGQAITLTSVRAPTYDPATSKETAGSTTTQTVSGVVLEYNTFIRSGVRNEKDSLIQAGDKQLLMSPLDAAGATLSPAPQINDTVVLADGKTFTITSLAPLAPTGLVIYFECNLRGPG